MALPGVSVTIQDGGLGILPSDSDNVFATFGTCSKGVVNQVYSFTDPATVRAQLGFGPLAEAVALKIAQGGGMQVAVPVLPAYDSVKSAVTTVASGTGTVTVAAASSAKAAPIEPLSVVCLTSGSLGTAVFKFSVGTSSYIATSAAGWSTGYAVVGTQTKLTFTVGTGYDATDAWTVSTVGTITQTTNAGAGTGNITAQASEFIDAAKVKIVITATGAAGVGRFKFACDDYTDADGNSLAQYSGDIVIPTSPYLFAIPNTGIVVTFSAGTYNQGDTFSFTALPCSMVNNDLQTAITAAGNSGVAFSAMHVCSTSYNVADDAALLTAADTLAGAIDAVCAGAKAVFRYIRAFVECPTSGTLYIDSDGPAPATCASANSAVVAQFVDFASADGRVCISAGDALIYSVLTGRLNRRNGAWIESARTAKVNRAIDPGKVLDGPLGGVVRTIYADANSDGLLDAARFLTLRSYTGLPGYYVTRGVTMASDTSDFSSLMNGRVMDLACAVARSSLLKYVNSEVRVDPVTGYIDEGEALRIEGAVNAALNASLVATGQASATSVTLSRNTNILSTSTEPVTVRVTPLGYLRNLEMTIGFINPAIPA